MPPSDPWIRTRSNDKGVAVDSNYLCCASVLPHIQIVTGQQYGGVGARWGSRTYHIV